MEPMCKRKFSVTRNLPVFSAINKATSTHSTFVILSQEQGFGSFQFGGWNSF